MDLNRVSDILAKAKVVISRHEATITALEAIVAEHESLPEWAHAGNNTLHGAIDHWQERATVAEAKLAETLAGAAHMVSVREGIIIRAFMAGQIDAGIDPSYSSAKNFAANLPLSAAGVE